MQHTSGKCNELAIAFRDAPDTNVKLKLATEIREQMEFIMTRDYTNFLTFLFPVFYNFLREGKPDFQDGPDNKLRNTILEIIAKLPNTESLKPNVANLLCLIMYLLEIENEDNALICLRIIIDLHKGYRNKKLSLDKEVEQFLKIVQTIYRDLPQTIENTFNAAPIEANTKAPPVRSLQSFKVLTESPIIVVLLFQLYPTCVKSNITKFMPSIMRTLSQKAPPRSYETHRIPYIDFIASQVKTLSFLAYLLRGNAEHVEPYQETIPLRAIELLRKCPRESAAIRKELLIATRHILATKFRDGFFAHIDTLLDEDVLIGTGRTAHDTLRPLAYSTLVDLVHHVREKLSLPQISKIVHLYSRNIHDNSLPFTIQTMSAKLLLNLVETIHAKNNFEVNDGRAVLIRILDAFVNKFSSLKKKIPKLLEEHEHVKECRALVVTLVVGLKNIVWGITKCSPAQRSNIGIGISLEESLIFNRLLKNALPCFVIFSSEPDSCAKKEKENLEGFAKLFAMLDTSVFQDIFRLYLPFLFEHIVTNPAMLIIPQEFLQAKMVSRTFLDILLAFLMERMDQLRGNEKRAKMLARLCKFAFGSVSSKENEMALKPHVTSIVNACITNGSEYKESGHYFGLLRCLFCAVSEGKFDWLYQEFLPLLPDLLRWLNKLLRSCHDSKMKDIFAELCLTVPARLPALTPFLDLLMQPLIWALHSANANLVAEGLSTFDSLISNLSVEFIQPIPAKIRQTLIRSVREHIQSPDSEKSMQALRILGKLAGSNRKFLYNDSDCDPVSNFEQIPHPTHNQYKLLNSDWTGIDVTDSCLLDGFEANLSLKPNHHIPLKLGRAIYFAYKQLLVEGNSAHENMQKEKSAHFLVTCLKAYLNESYSSTNPLSDCISSSYSPAEAQENVPAHHHRINRDVCQTLLTSALVISSSPSLSSYAGTIQEDLCRHFALLYTRNGFSNLVQSSNLLFVSPLIFIQAIIELITSECGSFKSVSDCVLDTLFKHCSLLVAKPVEQCTDMLWCSFLIDQLIIQCYESEWYKKRGACDALHLIISLIGPSPSLIQRIMPIGRALLYAVRDSSRDIPFQQNKGAVVAFQLLIDNATQIYATDKPLYNDNFNELVTILMSEASSSNRIVRDLVKESLNKITDPSMLIPSNVLLELTSKNMLDLPIEHQIGRMDGLAYFLQRKVEMEIHLSKDFFKVLETALDIIQKETLYEHPQFKRLRDRQEVREMDCLETDLKKSCILLLSIALSKRITKEVDGEMVEVDLISAPKPVAKDESKDNKDSFGTQIISVLFKLLALRASPIVEAARQGLSRKIADQLLPKELLQVCLRPILQHFAEYKKLTVAHLEGLARLLGLLTNCFNNAVGEKLLAHLKNWQDPSNISSWSESEAIEIANALIHIFHLLPPAGVKFLEQLVPLVITLENMLPRNISSPYRENLILYLNKYASHSIMFFYRCITMHDANNALSKTFQLVLRHPTASVLREYIMSNPDSFIQTTLRSENSHIVYQGIQIVRTINHFSPRWLVDTPTVLQALLDIWRNPHRSQRGMDSSMDSPLFYLRETKVLLKCLLHYCERQEDGSEILVLFHCLSVFCNRTTVDYTHVIDHCTHIANEGSIIKKTNVIRTYLACSEDPTIDAQHQVQILRILINPLLKKCFELNEGQQILQDKQLMDNLVNNILDDPGVPDSVLITPSQEAMSIELLQMATLLVQHVSELLHENRRKLLRFAWTNQLKADATNKQYANVLICRFIEAYDTPPRHVIQVYAGLLHCYHIEARQLVRKALDILTPTLKKLRPETAENHNPAWILCTKKILIEEGHTLAQLIHILQVLVRHPDLFYPCKGIFVQQIVTSLPRIGLMNNCPPENKKLTIDLVELIINWEKKRLTLAGTYPGGSGDNTNAMEIETEPIKEDNYTPSEGLVIVATNFLVRIVSATENVRDVGNQIDRAQQLLQEAFKIWPTVSVKLCYLDNILDTGKNKPELVLRGLQILEVVLAHQLTQGVGNSAPDYHRIILDFHRVITPALQSGDSQIVSRVAKTVLRDVVRAFPPSAAAAIKGHPEKFYNILMESIDIGLQHEKGKFCTSLLLLQNIASIIPEYVDRFLPGLVKLLQKLAKDHYSKSQVEQAVDAMAVDSSSSSSSSLPSGDVASSLPPSEPSEILLLCVELINHRIGYQNEQKKAFFQTILSIIEKSKNESVLCAVTSMIHEWILQKHKNGENGSVQTPAISSKEKINFLLRMMRFEQFPEFLELHKKFLDIIYYIYADNHHATTKEKKNERAQLEPGFMMGLRSPDPSIRGKFFRIFHNSVEKTLTGRMNYILAVQNWESLGSHFWMKQALDLLLALRCGPHAIQWMDSLPRLPPLCTKNNMSTSMGMDSSTSHPHIDTLYKEHQEFLVSLSSLKQKEMIDSLRDLMNLNEDLSYHLWTSLFPVLWLDFDEAQQVRFLNAFILLIAKEYHHAQRDVYPNVIQALLEGLCTVPLRTSPQNQVAFCQIIKYLGKTHNAWYFAIHILEKEYFRLLHTTGANDPMVPPEFLYSLAELYQLLSESDYYCSVWHHRSTVKGSHSAIVAQQFGQWEVGQKLFSRLLRSQIKPSSITPPPPPLPLPLSTPGLHTTSYIHDHNELTFWEDQVIQSCKHLSQWETLVEFGKENDRKDILMDCAWKTVNPDWQTMKMITGTKSPVLMETSQFLIAQCYTLISEKRISEIDLQLMKVHSKVLEEWNALPRMPSKAHIPALQQLQKLVELKESARILEQLSVQNNVQTVSEVRNTLLGWRERLPNEWEDITVWGDILIWRQYICMKISQAYQVSLQKNITHTGHREIGWTINKFSRVARKHGLIDVCITSLLRIYKLPHIEIQDAFVKLREQLKCYANIPSLYAQGLETINNTNLEYFKAEQKAEFFQLKGEFLSKSGFLSEANKAFGSSVQLVDMIPLPAGWLSWGHFCDAQFQSSRNPKWGESALACYARACTFRSNTARRKLGRCLFILSFHDLPPPPPSPEPSQDLPTPPPTSLAVFFLQQIEALPPWLWLGWIPQLLNALFFTEAPQILVILERIVHSYPQAIFYPLQRFIDEIEYNSTQMSNTSFLNPEAAFSYAQHMISTLKRVHPNLVREMSNLAQEIDMSLGPKAEALFAEELRDILLRVYEYEQSGKEDLIPLLKAIQEFAESDPFVAFGSETWGTGESIVDRFTEDFLRNKPLSMEELCEKVKKWITLFSIQFLSVSSVISLHSLSPALQQFENRNSIPLEIPGLYGDSEPTPEGHPTIDRFLPTIKQLGPNALANYKIQIQANDGNIHSFYVKYNKNPSILSAEERFSRLMKQMNFYCRKNYQMQQRILSFTTPPVIMLSLHTQLIQSNDSFTSLEEIWNWAPSTHKLSSVENLDRYFHMLRRLPNDDGDDTMTDDDTTTTSTRKLYDAMCEEVPVDTLTNILSSISPSYRQLFSLRSEFAAHFGLTGMLGIFFAIPDRSLENILFSVHSGNVYHRAFYPRYNKSFLLSHQQSVPFRLSRNVAKFINPFGVSGPFTASMHSLCMTVDQKKKSLEEHLQLFLRDDMVQWMSSGQDHDVSSMDSMCQAILQNYHYIINTAEKYSPLQITTENGDVYQAMKDLIDTATSPQNLSLLPPTLQPWF